MTLVLPKLLLNMSQIKNSFIGSKLFLSLFEHHHDDEMNHIEEVITVVQLATKIVSLKRI